jgi:hypothetical protein
MPAASSHRRLRETINLGPYIHFSFIDRLARRRHFTVLIILRNTAAAVGRIDRPLVSIAHACVGLLAESMLKVCLLANNGSIIDPRVAV